MPKIKGPPTNPDYELTMRLLNEFRNAWLEAKPKDVDDVRYSRMSLVSLVQLSAIIGVDIGMQPKQFEALSNANFKSQFEKAPRFA